MRIKSFCQNKHLYLFIVAVLYCFWAAYYIFNTSFTIPPNGERYYGLFDDAMISMRYGWNFAHGKGLVWNEGEYVEGITNLLMTIFMSIWALFLEKRFAVLMVQVSGVAFVLATGYLSMLVGTHILKARKTGIITPQVLFFATGLVYFPFNFWVLFGMETGMVSVLLLLAILTYAQVDGQVVVAKRLGIFLGLAFLARPDTAVATAIIMTFRFFGIVRTKGWFKTLLIEGGIIALFVVGVTLFRYFYYGAIVPNTYTLKVSGMPLPIRIDGGLVYLEKFVDTFWPIAIVALLGGLLHRHRLSLLLTSLFVGFTAYHVTIGFDPFIYWRQLSPYVPMILTAFVAELDSFALGKRLSMTPDGWWSWAKLGINHTVLTVVTISLFIYLNWEYRPVIEFDRNIPSVNTNRHFVIQSFAMNELFKPSATLGLFHAGTASYYTNFKCIDFLGKSDRHIASQLPDLIRHYPRNKWPYIKPGHNKYDLNYSIRDLQPTCIEGSKWERDDLRGYAKKYYTTIRFKYSTLYLRKNSPHVHWEKLRGR